MVDQMIFAGNPEDFAAEVQKTVKGSFSTNEVEERLRSHFSRPIMVWAQERGEHHFGVLIMPVIGGTNRDILCER